MEIRRYQKSDLAALADLFYHTVHSINAKDYTKEQLDAWATGQIDEEGWNRSLLEHYSIVALENGMIVGFGDIDRTGYLDRLYVHKDYQGRGIAAAICDELEKQAKPYVLTHASITAKPFFEKRGYRVVKEQQVERKGVYLTNYVMEKMGFQLGENVTEMKYIFIHGMGQNASGWDKTISFLPDNIETVCLELRDFFTEGNCYYDKMYAAFCDCCNAFSEPVNLCGLSLGAVLALNYAIDFPQRVNSLILIAPQYDMPKVLLKVQNVIFKFMPESQFKDVGLTKEDFIQLTNSMADMNFTGGLGKVSCPVLVLCGEKDNINKKTAVKFAEKLPGAKFSMIHNSGHEVNIDNPKELARAIEAYGRGEDI